MDKNTLKIQNLFAILLIDKPKVFLDMKLDEYILQYETKLYSA